LKIIRSQTALVIHLGHYEHRRLLEIIKLYPCIPSAHFPLSRNSSLPNEDENEKFLQDTLAEQREAISNEVRAMLADPERLIAREHRFELTLKYEEVERLLQVLNDVRIGSWIRLGSPEKRIDLSMITEKNARDYLALELSGEFQGMLLAALEGAEDS